MRPVLGEKPRIEEMFDDATRLLRKHDPPGRAHAVEDAGLHHRDRVVPVLVGDVLRMRADTTDSRVVDDDVEPAEVLDNPAERRVDLLAARDVHGVRAGSDAELRKLPGRRLGGRGVELEHGDVGPGLCELLGNPSAQPCPGARDDRHPSVESPHAPPPWSTV